MSAPFAAETIADANGLAALEEEWWDLWRRAPAATPFQSPAWALPWWRHFHPGALLTITVRSGGRLVALAPFYVEDGALGRRLLPVGISLSDYLDVLLDPECEAEAGAALARGFAASGDRWDSWELEELAPGAASFGLPSPEGYAETIADQTACPVLVLPEGARSLDEIVPNKMRRNLNLARNRAARRGAVAVEWATADTLDAALDTLFTLHAMRWRRRGGSGLIADERVRRFHVEAAPRLLEAGLLRLCVLSIDGRPASAWHSLRHRDGLFLYMSGMDPDFAFESATTLLSAYIIEGAREDGAREAHFLRGREAYKYAWGAADRWNRRRSFRRIAGAA